MEALFRNRRMFLDFVEAFVELGGARGALDFARAELLPQKFVTERLRAGAHDVVWKVPTRGGKGFAVFLMEHQSGVDYAMPMRMQLYKQALWQEHRAKVPTAVRQAQGFRWPLVLPVVLYTGVASWSAPLRLAEILVHGADFEDLCARLEYLLIDVARLSDARVTSPGNFARVILRLVRALAARDDGAECLAAIDALAPFWKHEELDLACGVVYHYLMASKPSLAMERRIAACFDSEAIMESPKILRRTVFDVWREEGHAEGHAEKEAADFRKDLTAMAQFFARKNLPWDVYGPDIEAVRTHDAMMDLLVDLATVADPAAFLRERFGR
jgi:hypothetical protein